MSLKVEFRKFDDSMITDPPVCLTTQSFEVYKGTDVHEQLSHVQKQ